MRPVFAFYPRFKLLDPARLVVLILCLGQLPGLGQSFAQKDTTNTKLMKAAREIMTGARYCALITLDDEGLPRARTMDPFAPDEDFTIWFGTNSKSRKVDQIRREPRVTIYYFDAGISGYVVIRGIAELVNDLKRKEVYWKDEWGAFYPNYPDNYLLIKVLPVWMEVISTQHGIFGDSITWEPPVIKFKNNN